MFRPGRASLAACVIALAACAKGPPRALGTLEYDRITVPAPVAERIVSIDVREGERIDAGTVLLTLDRTRVEAETQQRVPGGMELDLVDPLAEAVVRQEPGLVALGAPPVVEGASYWADAAFIAAAGIPTVIYGPSGEGAHALEEWVSLSDTEDVTRVLLDVARRVCG